jgi:hypothetical protein
LDFNEVKPFAIGGIVRDVVKPSTIGGTVRGGLNEATNGGNSVGKPWVGAIGEAELIWVVDGPLGCGIGIIIVDDGDE